MIQLAEEEAKEFCHSSVRNEHLLLALAKEGQSVAANILKNLGADYTTLQATVKELVPSGDHQGAEDCPLSAEVERVLHDALNEAYILTHHYIGTEHLILALVRSSDAIVDQILSRLGLDAKLIRNETLNLLGHEV